MQRTDPAAYYQQRIETLQKEKKKLLKRKSGYSWLRFFLLVAAFVSTWFLWDFNRVLAAGSAIIFLGLFIVSVIYDLKNKEAIENNRRLIKINETELKVLDYHYPDLPDGASLKPDNHAYANDLDIFGKASIYQYLNRTQSEQGNQLLAQWLLEPAPSSTILERQQSSIEIRENIDWSQQLRAYGMNARIDTSLQEKIDQWKNAPIKFRSSRFWKIFRILFPALALLILGSFLFGSLDASPFIVFSVFLLAISFGVSRLIVPHYLQLEKIVPELESLVGSLRWIETSPFSSEFITRTRAKSGSAGKSAYQEIKKLKGILERFEYRFNPLVHIPLNIYLGWDLQQIWAMEKWKLDNKSNIEGWFESLAEMECLCSIATLSHNQPDWVFPAISKDKAVFHSTDLGHPLIPSDKRVSSSFSTEGEKHLGLITGSNMAGKSTFLRSIGVNTVLAMMGAPVCCKQLELSNMKIISSMRVSDNLEENTSTFYAELKKLKEIIEAVDRQEPVFLLLDEILRGTNSADRHLGSMALIRQLIRKNASGLIATHDLELAKLADEFPGNLHNYHFDVQVNGEELYFDYKLKEGICQSMNASLLMKKIGIEM